MVLLNDLFEDFQGAPLSWSPPPLNMGRENKQPVLLQPPFASDGDEDDSPMTYGIRSVGSTATRHRNTMSSSRRLGSVVSSPGRGIGAAGHHWTSGNDRSNNHLHHTVSQSQSDTVRIQNMSLTAYNAPSDTAHAALSLNSSRRPSLNYISHKPRESDGIVEFNTRPALSRSIKNETEMNGSRNRRRPSRSVVNRGGTDCDPDPEFR